MADPIRLQILKNLTTILEEPIDPPAEFDLMTRVIRGRVTTGEEEQLPYVTIVEAPRPGFNAYAGSDQVTATTWPLLLQGYCKDDLKHPTDALYRFAAEVKLRLQAVVAERSNGAPAYPEFYMLGRDDEGKTLCAKFQFGPETVRPQDQSQGAKQCFYLPILITFAREVGA